MLLHLSRSAATGAVAAVLLVAGGLVAPARTVDQPRALAGVVDELFVEEPAVGDERGAERAVVEGAGVVTFTPVRVLAVASVTPDVVQCIPVAGLHGIPVDATGVVVNVTTVRPDAAGYAVVFPGTSGDGAPAVPATSTVNFEVGRDVASQTFIALGPDGDLCYATRGATQSGLLLDVSGYVEPGSGVVLAPPQRLLDTRMPGAGGIVRPMASRTVRTLQVAGVLGVPAEAESVVLTLTVTEVSRVGNLRIFPGGELTDTSVVNYAPGFDKANTTLVALAADGTVSLYSDSDGPVHVVVDVLGWTEAGGSHVGVEPTRVLDTRVDAAPGVPAAPLEAGFVYALEVNPAALPANATAIVLNVTAVRPTTLGNLRVYPGHPDGGPPPEVSSVNYIPGRDIPNLVVVGLANDVVDVYSDQPEGGTVHLAVDVVGYLTD